MEKISFKNATFLKSALLPEDYPILKRDNGKKMAEIAVVGRSNVGKSSLLNFLFESRGLVKTSSTPGKTKTINFFNVDRKICFVDLPGYGWAAGSKTEKKEWASGIDLYMQNRQELVFALFLLDIRRVPSEDDVMMLEFFVEREIPFGIVFTKVDKVSLSERQMRTVAILDALQVSVPYVYTSTLKKVGRDDLIHMIMEFV
jgi:GTP-binding protein